MVKPVSVAKTKLLAGLVGLAALFGVALAEPPSSKLKVVYHISDDDPHRQQNTLRNIQNHVTIVGADNLDLRVVLHGHGLSLLLPPDALPSLPKFRRANATEQIQATIDGLKDQGVTFNICGSTLRSRQVDPYDHLYNVDGDDIVTSGIAELAELQARGFTYLKP